MATLLSYAFISVADVKESLGISSGDTSQDNLIIRKINAATDMIENFLGRRIISTTYYDIEYDATDTNQLILQQRPVTEIISFQARGDSFNDDDWDDIETDLYFLDSAAGVIDLGFVAGGGWNRYRITYTAGYLNIPADLAEAAATLAAFLVQNPTNGAAIRSKEEGQRRIEYYDTKNSSSNLFDQLGIDDVLQLYANEPLLAD